VSLPPLARAVLACPGCRGAPLAEGEDALTCPAGHRFLIHDGIPRFVGPENYAGSFGFQWKALGRVQLDSCNGTRFSADRFRDITGWTADDLRGRRVLDAGCGAGRFAEVVKGFGADLVAFDLSAAVEACRANLEPGAPLVCQASIYEPPFPEASFDYVYCIGVLQHTPDPALAIRRLCRLVRPGGRIGLWIYEDDWKSYVGTLGFRRLLRPLVCRLPRHRQIAFARALASVFFPVVWPARRMGWWGRALVRLTPVSAAHLMALPLSREDFRTWLVLDTFDMYASRYDQPQTFAAVAAILAQEGFVDLRRHPHGAIAVTARRG
jgi:SAM-dependent methyltransferase